MTPAEKLAVIESMRGEGKTAKEIGRVIGIEHYMVQYVCEALRIKKRFKREVAGAGRIGQAHGSRPMPEGNVEAD